MELESQCRPRRVSNQTFVLASTPESVFPLLCPVREYDWIPGWDCDMIYSRSGIAELGCIFQTKHDLGDEVWTTTRYEPPNAIDFVRVLPAVWVVTMSLSLSPRPEGGATLGVTHCYTALSDQGAAMMEQLDETERWTSLVAMISHYLETGTMATPA